MRNSNEVKRELSRGGLYAPFWVVFILFIGIIGFYPAKDISIGTGKQLLSEWVVLAFIGMFFIKNVWLKTFFLWCVLMTIRNYNRFSFYDLYTIFLYLMFYQLIIDRVKIDKIKIVLNGICVIAFIQLFWMVLQVLGLDPLFKDTGWAVQKAITGFLMNRDTAGAFLAIVLPAFFRKGWVFLIPLVIAGIILTGSLTAVITGAVSILFYAFFKMKNKRNFIYALSGISIIAGTYAAIFERGVFLTGSGRFPVWKVSFSEFFMLQPITGWGLGQFKIAFPVITKKYFPELAASFHNPHNEFLLIAVELGAIGLIIALCYFGDIFIKFFKNRTDVSLILAAMGVAAITNANGNFLMHSIVGVIAVVIFALLERTVCDDNKVYG